MIAISAKLKQNYKVRITIAMLLLFAAFGGQAQEKEHFSLFTDRDFYTSGEMILFNVLVPETEPSGVVRIDLVSTRGKVISGVSKLIKHNHADGFIYLPDSLKTGTYLICTSTKINPTITGKELFVCNRFTGFSETTTLLRAHDLSLLPDTPAPSLSLEGVNPAYKTRENGQVTLQLAPDFLSKVKGSLSVAIAQTTPGYQSQPFRMSARTGRSKLMEKDGIVLEGMARDLVTDAPFKNGCIFLSIPDSIPRLDYFITGEDGHFNFEIKNHFGKIPVVVQGFDLLKKNLFKISLTRFDTLTSSVPAFESQPLPSDLPKSAESAIESTTLGKIFNCQEIKIENPPVSKKREYPFYGEPTETVYPHLFIDLPDFTEISRELLPGVKFRAFNRIPTLEILNPITLNYFADQPLLTLDGIPVRDLNVVKNMGSKDISRVEISRKERFYGDLAFPGVVAIFSTKPDYKRLNESEDLIKLSLDAFQPDVSLVSPGNLPQNDPDLRKVLLWIPNLKPEASVKLDFQTSDLRGTYRIVVRGTTMDGTVIANEQSFEVK
jgi:hypothetical protein